jgi:ABC-type sulfate transport system permease subunit
MPDRRLAPASAKVHGHALDSTAIDQPASRSPAVVLFFEILLILMFGIVSWFGFYVVYKLFKGQS